MKTKTKLTAVAVCASLVLCSFAHAVPPPLEKKGPDVVVPSAGIPPLAPSGQPWASVGLDDAVITAGPVTPEGRVLYQWTRDNSGKEATWSWAGLLPISGTLPTGTASTAALRIVTDHQDTVAYTQLVEGITVVRRVGGAWEFHGFIPVGNTSTTLLRSFSIAGDTALTSGNTTATFWRFDSTAGTWGQVAVFPIELGPPGYAPGGFGSAGNIGDGFAMIGTCVPSSTWATTGRSALHVYGLKDPANPIPLEDIVQTEPLPWALGPGMCAGDDWIVVKSVSRPDPIGQGRMAFYRRNEEGEFSKTQLASMVSTETAHAIHNGHLMTGLGIWSLGEDGVWYRGPALTSGPVWVTEGDGVRVLADGTLGVWRHVVDCDQNGLDDALEIAAGTATDCNRNGRPDSCDITDGLLTDANANDIPDACEADCDENGISDLTQIRDGAATACDDPYLLAACAIANGAGDVNGDGIADACGPDLNDNGIPDAIEIANGTAADCGGDGVPDDFTPYGNPFAQTLWYYVGYPLGSAMVLSMGYDTDPESRWLTRIDVITAVTASADPWSPIGKPYDVHVFTDPNGDGLVNDGELLWTGSEVFQMGDQTISVPGIEIPTIAFVIAFAPPPGTFVYSWTDNLNFDNIPRGLFGAGGNSIVVPLQNSHPGIRGVHAVFTDGIVPPDPQEALATGGFNGFALGITAHTGGCPLAGDITGDGLVNGADLGILLGDWERTNSAADLNADGIVDGADLGILLGAWTY